MKIRQLTAALLAALPLTLGASALAQTTITPLEILNEAPASDWVRVDPENILLMELPSGKMYIEMRPDMAPAHVQQVTTLTREGFYNGVIFHRVIDGFMAQGGDPTGTGQGGSELPNIQPEFAKEVESVRHQIIGRDDRAAQVGFIGTTPIATQAPTLTSFLADQSPALWGMHCPGVMSMARADRPDSANSQFFVMFGDSRDGLDQGYTVWGRVVAGYKNARRINRGEPPTRPTPIIRMRVLSDVPAEEQVDIEYLNPESDAFMSYLKSTRQVSEDGFVRDMCNIFVPVRVNGEYTQ